MVASSNSPISKGPHETYSEATTQDSARSTATCSNREVPNRSLIVASESDSASRRPLSAPPAMARRSSQSLSNHDPPGEAHCYSALSISSGRRSAVSQAWTSNPDFWLLAIRRTGNITYSLTSLIGAVKVHAREPDQLAGRRMKTREAYLQAIMHLVTSWLVCGTWLGFAFVNSKFGRLIVVKVEILFLCSRRQADRALSAGRSRRTNRHISLWSSTFRWHW